MKRLLQWRPGWTPGFILGGLLTAQFSHVNAAIALTLKANTQSERIGAIMIGVVALIIILGVVNRLFGAMFFHGFSAASGTFLSVDIVLFHWIFQLHRITNGPEANVLEPIFVVCGSALAWYGYTRGRAATP